MASKRQNRVSQENLKCVGYFTHTLNTATVVAMSDVTWRDASAVVATLSSLRQLGGRFIRFRSSAQLVESMSGQDPTGINGAGEIGFQLEADKSVWYDVEDLNNIKLLNESGGAAQLYGEIYS